MKKHSKNTRRVRPKQARRSWPTKWREALADEARKMAQQVTAMRSTTEQAAAAARTAALNIVENPEWAAIRKELSVPEIVEAVKAHAKKLRGKGRPRMPNKFEVLDACAKVKATGGHYTKLAPRFDMTPKQLSDLADKNRSYFNRQVRNYQLRKNA